MFIPLCYFWKKRHLCHTFCAYFLQNNPSLDLTCMSRMNSDMKIWLQVISIVWRNKILSNFLFSYFINKWNIENSNIILPIKKYCDGLAQNKYDEVFNFILPSLLIISIIYYLYSLRLTSQYIALHSWLSMSIINLNWINRVTILKFFTSFSIHK